MRFLRESLALAGLAFQIGVGWYFWSTPPARIPMHYGFRGRPDSYADKSGMIVLPIITLVLYAFLTILSFFPQGFNYPVTVTDRNRGRLQALGVAVIGWIKAEIIWLFAYITWQDIRVGLGVSSGLGWAFLPVTLAAIGATITVAIVQMRRAE